MSGEVKQRKKGGSPTSKEAKDTQRSGTAAGQRANDDNPGKLVAASSVSASRSMCPDVRTLLCCLCLALCATLTWMVFQQSQNFTLLEQKYQSLQSRSSALEDLEAKVGDIFGKLVSTDDSLAEATASSSLVNNLQQQISSLHNDIDHIQFNEQELSKMMQNVNIKFQNVTDTWKKNLDDMNMETNSIKTETKSFHQQMTLKVNSADQTLKVISEKLKEFEESTPRNFRTVKRQEDEDLQRITDVLDYDAKAIQDLIKQQNELANMDQEVLKNIVQFEPKLAECVGHLPVIDNAVGSLLKVSNEMHDLDKKINELTVQVFNTEDNLLKIISETLEIQHALESMKYDNSILKLQNEISVLKERTETLSSTNEKSVSERDTID
ncbi:PREDICTED: inhibitor of nuclear factor kappa-B kinase-interacting protein isoform X1 [Nanorana parkeri]|uniref:inhibitor of nuclear factor kappa-B kinase-interacting protein isoform X1 n=1 Tax=Nanorana parkeri TaxID=125878 RepID=UPI000853F16E|nr:PREDICTED: inhibitor of nuclear factor kappa-B kinase-interacting protein isoform X1 [Nanorana parkeri]